MYGCKCVILNILEEVTHALFLQLTCSQSNVCEHVQGKLNVREKGTKAADGNLSRGKIRLPIVFLLL